MQTMERQQELEIAGTLKKPIVAPMSGGDGVMMTYHWVTDDNRHTFLHLLITKDPRKQFGVATENIDSEEVRGQGDALGHFLTERIAEYADSGIGDSGSFPIVHKVLTNKYSFRLPNSDPRYKRIGQTMEFYAVYMPHTVISKRSPRD